MGVGIAALIVLQKRMAFDLSLGREDDPIGKLLGLGLLAAVCFALYRAASRVRPWTRARRGVAWCGFHVPEARAWSQKTGTRRLDDGMNGCPAKV
jgi:hypothetical protein